MAARQTFSDQIRNAIDASGHSRYAICKAIGLDQSVMSKFMAGTTNLSMANLDLLAELLNLQICVRSPKVAPKAKKGRRA